MGIGGNPRAPVLCSAAYMLTALHNYLHLHLRLQRVTVVVLGDAPYISWPQPKRRVMNSQSSGAERTIVRKAKRQADR